MPTKGKARQWQKAGITDMGDLVLLLLEKSNRIITLRPYKTWENLLMDIRIAHTHKWDEFFVCLNNFRKHLREHEFEIL